MRITRRVEFDMAHRLPDHEGKCFRLHGHRYVVDVSVEGDVRQSGSENGMVIDFAALDLILERFVKRFDHMTMLYSQDPLYLFITNGAAVQAAKDADAFPDGMTVDADAFGILGSLFVPTAENLAQYFFNMLTHQDIGVTEVTVYETPKSCATARTNANVGAMAYTPPVAS